MQALGRVYVQYLNHTYGRTGTLWDGRYKATLIDSEAYILTCCRYIELNPVRARMVEHPAEYPWSSYRRNALGQHEPLVTFHRLYLGLGASAESRCERYQHLFDVQIAFHTITRNAGPAHPGASHGSPRALATGLIHRLRNADKRYGSPLDLGPR